MTETAKEFIDRTMRKRTTATGEESGSFSWEPTGPKSTTYVVTEIVDPKTFAVIAKNYPKNTRNRDKKQNELSWWGSSDEVRESVIIDVSKQNVKIFMSTDENRPDKTRTSEKGYLKIFKEAVGAMIAQTEADHIDLYLDNNPYVSPEVMDEVARKIAGKANKTITINHVRSHEELIIQVQDFIAGSADSKSFFDIIENKVMFRKKS